MMSFARNYFHFLHLPVAFHHLLCVPAMPGFLPWSRSFSAAVHHSVHILLLFYL